jgi:hypothetical protein
MKYNVNPPVDHDAIVAAFERKLAGIAAQDGPLLAEQLELEKAGVVPEEPSALPNVRRMAAEMLNGSAPAALGEYNQGERLSLIIRKRAAIAEALQKGSHEHFKLCAVRLAWLLDKHGREWREIVRKRAMALLELRKANREAAAFRRMMISAAGIQLSLRCDRQGGPVFGEAVSDPAYEFLQEAIQEGFLLASEVAP